jgi:acyl carrier protein
MAEDIYERLKKIVIEELEVTEDAVRPEAKFQEDLGADSLDVVELTMKIEDEFGIKIPDEDVEKLLTIEDAVNYIEEKLKEKKS